VGAAEALMIYYRVNHGLHWDRIIYHKWCPGFSKDPVDIRHQLFETIHQDLMIVFP